MPRIGNMYIWLFIYVCVYRYKQIVLRVCAVIYVSNIPDCVLAKSAIETQHFMAPVHGIDGDRIWRKFELLFVCAAKKKISKDLVAKPGLWPLNITTVAHITAHVKTTNKPILYVVIKVIWSNALSTISGYVFIMPIQVSTTLTGASIHKDTHNHQ